MTQLRWGGSHGLPTLKGPPWHERENAEEPTRVLISQPGQQGHAVDAVRGPWRELEELERWGWGGGEVVLAGREGYWSLAALGVPSSVPVHSRLLMNV